MSEVKQSVFDRVMFKIESINLVSIDTPLNFS